MELEFRRVFNQDGCIEFLVYASGSDKEKELLEKAWSRLENRDGIKVDDNTYIGWMFPSLEEEQEGVWRVIYAKDTHGRDVDVTKYHIDKLVDMLKEAISKMKKEVVYVYTI